ncbi:MAG TPA: SH3 domain-containing protein, partial [Kiloniellales bacterium]|nr:SH3 domain-containing protein [Kiloniellales bacterium]
PAPTPPVEPDGESQVRLLYVTPDVVNLRAEASSEAPVVGRVTRGTAVPPLERSGSWVRIRTPDDPSLEGWIHSSLLAEAPGE